MSDKPGRCSQHGCEDKADFYYTWPGEGESGACLKHANAISYLAMTLGFRVPMVAAFDRVDPVKAAEVRDRARRN
jgi:hypothetical protein